MKVGIFANPDKERVVETLRMVCSAFEERGCELALEGQTASLLAEREGGSEFYKGCDLVVSLGGDGTLLEALHRMGGCSVPIAGVNIGTLGFLTTCAAEDVGELVERTLAGSLKIVERSVLDVEVEEDGVELRKLVALNELAMLRSETGRIVQIDAYVNGDLLNNYRADGLLVATPTGSTAYSLAASGPLVAPSAKVLIVNPVCPHSLSNRAVVVADSAQVELRPGGAERDPVLLSVDGRGLLKISAKSVVRVTVGKEPFRLVRFSEHSFYETLRRKMKWG